MVSAHSISIQFEFNKIVKKPYFFVCFIMMYLQRYNLHISQNHKTDLDDKTESGI